MKQLYGIVILLLDLSLFTACGQNRIVHDAQLTAVPVQFEKTEFEIAVQAPYANPYDSREAHDRADLVILNCCNSLVIISF